MIKLYKDGDQMAIQTDAKDERDFIDTISEALSNMLSDGMFIDVMDDKTKDIQPIEEWTEKKGKTLINDWHFQFEYWLPQIVDICCKYRGYKSTVQEQRVLITGDIILSGVTPVYSTDVVLEGGGKEKK